MDVALQTDGGIAAAREADLRMVLRRETAEAHARLDAGWEGHDLTRRRAYAAFLSGMAGALLPLEARLEAAGVAARLPDWSARRRSRAILSDLAGLGAEPAPLPGLGDVAGLGGAGMAGILYVLEGSRLGGTVILRRVLAGPDASLHDHVRFLRHGEGLRLWPSFAAWLAADEAAQADRIGAVAGARFAFAAFAAAQGAATLPAP